MTNSTFQEYLFEDAEPASSKIAKIIIWAQRMAIIADGFRVDSNGFANTFNDVNTRCERLNYKNQKISQLDNLIENCLEDACSLENVCNNIQATMQAVLHCMKLPNDATAYIDKETANGIAYDTLDKCNDLRTELTHIEDLLIKVECGLDVLKSKLNQEEKQNEKVSN